MRRLLIPSWEQNEMWKRWTVAEQVEWAGIKYSRKVLVTKNSRSQLNVSP